MFILAINALTPFSTVSASTATPRFVKPELTSAFRTIFTPPRGPRNVIGIVSTNNRFDPYEGTWKF